MKCTTLHVSGGCSVASLWKTDVTQVIELPGCSIAGYMLAAICWAPRFQRHWTPLHVHTSPAACVGTRLAGRSAIALLCFRLLAWNIRGVLRVVAGSVGILFFVWAHAAIMGFIVRTCRHWWQAVLLAG